MNLTLLFSKQTCYFIIYSNISRMVTSLDCYILGDSIKRIFSVVIGKRILLKKTEIQFTNSKISHLKAYIWDAYISANVRSKFITTKRKFLINMYNKFFFFLIIYSMAEYNFFKKNNLNNLIGTYLKVPMTLFLCRNFVAKICKIIMYVS